MNILLREDDRRTASFVVRGFNELGHGVGCAIDAREEKALERRYGVMAVDRMLPGSSRLAHLPGRDRRAASRLHADFRSGAPGLCVAIRFVHADRTR